VCRVHVLSDLIIFGQIKKNVMDLKQSEILPLISYWLGVEGKKCQIEAFSTNSGLERDSRYLPFLEPYQAAENSTYPSHIEKLNHLGAPCHLPLNLPPPMMVPLLKKWPGLTGEPEPQRSASQ
jgi:hypothetical protein